MRHQLEPGGGQNNDIDDAGNAVVDGWVVFVAVAGNGNKDVSRASPANAKKALTVGSATTNDNQSGFSNYGMRVDLFAPGSGIKLASADGDNKTTTMNGTSMDISPSSAPRRPICPRRKSVIASYLRPRMMSWGARGAASQTSCCVGDFISHISSHDAGAHSHPSSSHVQPHKHKGRDHEPGV